MVRRLSRVGSGLLLAMIAACGGDGDSSAGPASSGRSASSGPPAPSESPAPDQAAGDSCGGVVDKVESHLASAAEVRSVRNVRVVGGCTSVEILTTLGDADSAAATRLCTSAAEVAYSKHTNGLTVLSAAGKELAVGIAGASCIGEP